MRTAEAAKGRWRGILRELGIDDAFLRNRHGPCPLCGGTDRWRWDDKDGRGTFFCSNCGSGDGMDLAIRWTGQPFKAVATIIDGLVLNIQPEQIREASRVNPERRIQKVLRESAAVARGDAVSTYLRARHLPRSPMLRCHPNLQYWDDGQIYGAHPAMIALFSTPAGDLSTLHVTYLSQHGEKADVPGSAKKIFTSMRDTKGGAIRLTRIYPHMGIAEGVETALAVMRMFNVPCWAAATAGFLEEFIPPEGVESMTIFGDHDSNYAGHKASYVLAHKLRKKPWHMPVDVRLPERVGTDFADELEGMSDEDA